jgi:biopolymer transport protein ExbD
MYSGDTNRQQFNEINITPLTDIFLVLLIIMMVVAPMVQQQNTQISPPQLASGQPVDQGKLTVEVTQDGGIFLGGQQTTPESLIESLKAKAPVMTEKNVVIRADKTTRSGAVMKVFEAARDAGFEKVTIAGDPITSQRSQELQQSPAAQPVGATSDPMALPPEP